MGNTKERRRRERKAYERGVEARRSGVPLASNPLELSAHGVGAEWARGWIAEDLAIKKRAVSGGSPGEDQG